MARQSGEGVARLFILQHGRGPFGFFRAVFLGGILSLLVSGRIPSSKPLSEGEVTNQIIPDRVQKIITPLILAPNGYIYPKSFRSHSPPYAH